MQDFFEKRDPWGHGLALWVLVAMAFLAPLAWWSIRRIDLQNNVSNWLPRDDPQARTLDWYTHHFPAEDGILVSWQGSSLNDPRVEQLAGRLEGTPDPSGVRRGGVVYVKRVITPRQVIEQMTERGVQPDEAVRRLQGVLIGSGKMRVRLTDAGRQRYRQTVDLLKDRVQSELGITLQIAEPLQSQTAAGLSHVPVMPAAEPARQDELFDLAAPHDFRIAWKGMHLQPKQVRRVKQLAKNLRSGGVDELPDGRPLIEDCFFVPGAPVAVAVTLSEAGSADKQAALAAIRRAAAEVGIETETVHLGGRPVAGSELNQAVKRTAWNPAHSWRLLHRRSPLLVSVIAGVLLAFALLRSVRMAVSVLAVTFYTTFLAVAVVPVTGGSMNMVLVVMPTLLMVLTLSAAIHVANYWDHAARKDRGTALIEAVRMARQPCTLASLTTAVGLLSLTASPLTPVRDFGIYSAVGCLLALAMVLYGLPSMLQFWPAGSPKQGESDPAAWRRLGGFLARHRTAVTVAALALFAGCGYGLTRFRTETKVIRYFDDGARVVQDYRFLEENLAGIVPVETVIRFNPQEQRRLNFLERLEVVREVEEGIRRHPEISGTLSLADFQPVYEPLSAEASTAQRMLHNKKVSQVEQRAKQQSAAASAFLTMTDEPAHRSGPGVERLNSGSEELWRITAQVAILSDLDYSQLTAELDEIAQSTLKYHAGAGHVVTGMVPVFLRTQQAVLESLIRSFGLAFGVIGVLMMVLLRSPIAGALTMLPNLLPVGVVFGLVSWAGMAVDIGTMITASVALGIAVDGTLHLLTWFRQGVRRGMSRRVAVSHALTHAGPALWQTSAVVGLGLLMLFGADLLLVSRFGWLMAALIGAALLADVVFLPALLAGPLGILIARTVAEEKPGQARVLAPQPRPNLSRPHLPVGDALGSAPSAAAE